MSKDQSRGPQEIELKLEADPEGLEGVRAHPLVAPLAFQRSSLAAVYFDTPDQALRQAGVSLRIRRDGARALQTVKAGRASGTAALARGEWEHEVEGDALDLSRAEGTALEPFAGRGEAIRPAFRVEVERDAATAVHGGSTIEIALDAGRVLAGEAAESLAEVELELKAGRSADLFALALALADAAPLRLGFRTKSDRGYALLAGDRPTRVKAEPVALKRKTPAAEAFRIVAASCLRHLLANEAVLRVSRDPDAVHQMRVALRRLRAAFTLFKAVAADERSDAIRAELKWMAGSLGEARDLDVFIARTLEPAAADPAVAALLDEYRARRERAYDAAQEAVASTRFRRGTLETAAWLEAGAWRERAEAGDGGRSVRRHARRELDRRWRRVRKRSRDLAGLGPEARHEVRIEVKKLRYAVEFFEGLFKGRSAKAARRQALDVLSGLQETLGDLNDRAVAGGLGAEAAAALGLGAGPSEAELVARATALAEELAGLERFWEQ